MRNVHHPSCEEISLHEVLHALSDPVRLEIVRGLAAGTEKPCGSLGVPVSRSTLSHHLKVLREAGVIEGERRGTWVFYR
ncbi:MAG: metalloregulator ArsR/SmtB family transcription factor, partial [Actinomycetota bacterium]|nr:metalloregulator ArsR/SmtB family transcription factor [Actinomycetota bacterium]